MSDIQQLTYYDQGNVKLQPILLSKHQKYVSEKTDSKDTKPVFLVFHGGSGSSKEEYKEAISYGVCKVHQYFGSRPLTPQ